MSSEKPNLPSVSTPGSRVQLMTDAVIMAYIHEISARHRTARTGGAAAA